MGHSTQIQSDARSMSRRSDRPQRVDASLPDVIVIDLAGALRRGHSSGGCNWALSAATALLTPSVTKVNGASSPDQASPRLWKPCRPARIRNLIQSDTPPGTGAQEDRFGASRLPGEGLPIAGSALAYRGSASRSVRPQPVFGGTRSGVDRGEAPRSRRARRSGTQINEVSPSSSTSTACLDVNTSPNAARSAWRRGSSMYELSASRSGNQIRCTS